MDTSNKKYYVYLHRTLTGKVFYVGKGRNYRANMKSGRSKEWRDVALNGYTVEIVKDCLSNADAISLETELYEEYKDSLVNKLRPTKVKEIKYEFLKTLFEISKESPSGLIWKADAPALNRGILSKRGKRAGRLTDKYWVLRLFGKSLRVNRIVYCLHTKSDIPDYLLVDHKDGDRSNNSTENLQAVTYSQNARNKLNTIPRKNQDTGTTGVIRVRLKEYDYFMAQWRTIDNKNRSKSFSIKKYGESTALRLAIEWRQQQIALLNEQGAGYTERHGTRN